MFRQNFILKLIIFSVTAFISLNARVVDAQQIQNPVGFDSVEDIINSYIPLFRIIVVMIFIGVLIAGGFTYLTAGSDDEKVANAKKIIAAGIGGFIIIILAPAITNFIGALLNVDGGLLSGFTN